MNLGCGIEKCRRYIQDSLQNRNVIFKETGVDCFVYASRDIKLFLHYGFKYWLSNIIKEREDTAWKSFISMLDGLTL